MTTNYERFNELEDSFKAFLRRHGSEHLLAALEEGQLPSKLQELGRLAAMWTNERESVVRGGKKRV